MAPKLSASPDHEVRAREHGLRSAGGALTTSSGPAPRDGRDVAAGRANVVPIVPNVVPVPIARYPHAYGPVARTGTLRASVGAAQLDLTSALDVDTVAEGVSPGAVRLADVLTSLRDSGPPATETAAESAAKRDHLENVRMRHALSLARDEQIRNDQERNNAAAARRRDFDDHRREFEKRVAARMALDEQEQLLADQEADRIAQAMSELDMNRSERPREEEGSPPGEGEGGDEETVAPPDATGETVAEEPVSMRELLEVIAVGLTSRGAKDDDPAKRYAAEKAKQQPRFGQKSPATPEFPKDLRKEDPLRKRLEALHSYERRCVNTADVVWACDGGKILEAIISKSHELGKLWSDNHANAPGRAEITILDPDLDFILPVTPGDYGWLIGEFHQLTLHIPEDLKTELTRKVESWALEKRTTLDGVEKILALFYFLRIRFGIQKPADMTSLHRGVEHPWNDLASFAGNAWGPPLETWWRRLTELREWDPEGLALVRIGQNFVEVHRELTDKVLDWKGNQRLSTTLEDAPLRLEGNSGTWEDLEKVYRQCLHIVDTHANMKVIHARNKPADGAKAKARAATTKKEVAAAKAAAAAKAVPPPPPPGLVVDAAANQAAAAGKGKKGKGKGKGNGKPEPKAPAPTPKAPATPVTPAVPKAPKKGQFTPGSSKSICRNFASTGKCSYGEKCCYKHGP
jgi:hypothetical protein